MYPTAAKLVAALLFAALTWWVADLVRPLLPEQRPARWLNPISAGFGLVAGWRLVGAQAGQGYLAAVGRGWTALAVVAIAGLVFWSGQEVMERVLDRFYRGPSAAFDALVRQVSENATILFSLGPVLAGVAGAALCGVVTEFVSRRAS
jgi:hypothetical protein